jgi:hypothetical protein
VRYISSRITGTCIPFAVDSSLHVALDKYEFIALTVSLETGKKLLKFLEDDFVKRQRMMDLYGELQSRVFDVSSCVVRFCIECANMLQSDPITGAEFQLVLLHPYQLLPYQLPLHRRGPSGTWESYIVTNDGLLRATLHPGNTDAEEFPKFTFQSSRLPAETLNPWFVIMNAGIKFDRFRDNFGLDTLHSSMAEIAKQTLEIVDLIYKPITPTDKYNQAHASPKKRGTNFSEEGGVGMGRELRSTMGKGKSSDRGGREAGTSSSPAKKGRLPAQPREISDLFHPTLA